MSIQESALLLELVRLVRDLTGRVSALEQRSPGREPWPADILDRLALLEHRAGQSIQGSTAPTDAVPELLRRIEALEVAAIAAANSSDAGNEQRQTSGNWTDITQRLEALEARRDPVSLRPSNAQRIAHGEALRVAIADIMQSDPGATGPRVIEALRASHAGKLPSLRTVRWHLAAIRGNGNSLADAGESATQTLENQGA